MMNGWWLPKAISQHALSFDIQFARTLIAALVIFGAAQCALVVVAWRYRANANRNARNQGARNTRAELIWTSATALVFLGLLLMGGRIWAEVQFTAAPVDSEVIQVLAKQFAWNFRYPGPDGVFGRTNIRLINDAAGNPFGLDPQDSNSRDDIVAAVLRVPAGRPVKLTLTSLDVIHSFFVRELRMKQDVVPGMQIPFHFRADVPGTYEVPCAELCGLGHSQMRTTVLVMPAVDYDRWKREQAH
jgi:cytochrome c oxidase subunit II